MKTGLIIASLFVLLALAVSWAVYAWVTIGEVEMSAHGWIAMALGVIFSVLVAGALMSLVFFSSRHGYDEPPDLRHDRK
jgi:hypothetical protein